jgi:predicted naringenin-chalcone synthase
LSKIISVATGVPAFKHLQDDLFTFADNVYSREETDSRKLRFLYRQSGIDQRYSVVPDFTAGDYKRTFFSEENDLEPFPSISKRMEIYNIEAPLLSEKTILDCINGKIDKSEITHLITVSCTGMTAPGLDLQLMEQLELSKNLIRTSVNFMGCYAAVHALKLADAFCTADKKANVVIVCTELCTLHFQKEISVDNLTSSLLFGDGCAAVLVQNDGAGKGLKMDGFYSEVSFKGKNEMAWALSSTGFLMTLSGYIPELIKEDFKELVNNALISQNRKENDISHWCIHPGGKKILDAIAESMEIEKSDLHNSYEVLKDYGNMSSPTILFVLEKILHELHTKPGSDGETVFGAAFGPGLTMETFTAVYG